MKFLDQAISKLEPEQNTQTQYFAPVTVTLTNDLGIWISSRYFEHLHAYRTRILRSRLSEVRVRTVHTHRHTDRDPTQYSWMVEMQTLKNMSRDAADILSSFLSSAALCNTRCFIMPSMLSQSGIDTDPITSSTSSSMHSTFSIHSAADDAELGSLFTASWGSAL